MCRIIGFPPSYKKSQLSLRSRPRYQGNPVNSGGIGLMVVLWLLIDELELLARGWGDFLTVSRARYCSNSLLLRSVLVLLSDFCWQCLLWAPSFGGLGHSCSPPPPPCSWVLWRPGDLVIPGLIGADQLRQKSGLLPLNRVRPSEQRLDQLLRSLGQGFGRVSRHGGVGGECFYSLPAFCLFGIPCGSRFTDYGFL